MKKPMKTRKFIMLGERDAKTGKIVKNESYPLVELALLCDPIRLRKRSFLFFVPKKWVRLIATDTIYHVIHRLSKLIDEDNVGKSKKKK